VCALVHWYRLVPVRQGLELLLVWSWLVFVAKLVFAGLFDLTRFWYDTTLILALRPYYIAWLNVCVGLIWFSVFLLVPGCCTILPVAALGWIVALILFVWCAWHVISCRLLLSCHPWYAGTIWYQWSKGAVVLIPVVWLYCLWSGFGLASVGSDLELFVRIMIYPHAIRPIIALMLCCHAVLLSRLNLLCWLVLACPPPLWNLCGFEQVPTGTSIWEVIYIIWE
jgi:hypothetical protein